MATAVSSYILNHLPEGTIVAVTKFATFATELAGMTNITTDSVRDNLTTIVPTSASGLTDIEAGLELCREVMSAALEGNW